MTFVSGLELCRRFHGELVGPAIRARFPGLAYAAARLDSGSELFGLDSRRSMDHDWGPRLQVYLDRGDMALAPAVTAAVDAALPAEFLGLPTRFVGHPASGLGVLAPGGDRHGVTVAEVGGWLLDALGFDPREGVGTADWLAVPTQRLAEFTGGAVFHDGLPGAALSAARTALRWYPTDVWRYVLAAQWARIGQEEHLVGRCAEVGDDLGSTILAARVARDLMRLFLLLERRYPPYGKWLGSQFARLPGVAPAVAALTGAVRAADWPRRERALGAALTLAAERTNALGLAEPVEASVRPFHRRPFLVLGAERFAAGLRAAIGDPELAARPPVGAVDQFVDSTEVTTRADRARRIAGAVLSGPRPDPNDR
ncbi:DUF4037 domain-containing protein [Plantactinospora sp. KBS50]|uniref:DUF4037 domain-containing protein n=1 Tax=Plantactinospora sp. KBS50 TaxID=2024580 RepID=UPI000BAB0CD0|nr:DUF4037 domain-containing protein [Plantactinospora sp. KBS50]ASW55070.1 hypothetical protein CIK06_14100 [Plantactinospora sp. KBS50]